MSIRSYLLRLLAALLLVQASIISVLVLLRKLRRKIHSGDRFPVCATHPVQIGETQAQIYPEGTMLYQDMLEAIAGARESVMFETFLWLNDEVGRQFKTALIERARAGVQVYIVYDALANILRMPDFKQFPTLPTLHVRRYRSVRRPWHLFKPERFGRDHRKILVVDGKVCFVGGFNIGEKYRGWRDTQVGLRGPAVHEVTYAFADFWNRIRGSQPAIELPPHPWTPDIRVYCNDRFQLTLPLHTVYLNAIDRAQQRILITQAYFVPDRLILRALMRAAERGVDVRVLLPWESNHLTADWLSRHRFGACLRSGARLFGYLGPTLHAKTATIDGRWTMIGTANMDRLSLIGNNEINVELFDDDLARQMEAIFECDVANSFEITREAWEQRPWYQRAAELTLSPLWPLV